MGSSLVSKCCTTEVTWSAASHSTNGCGGGLRSATLRGSELCRRYNQDWNKEACGKEGGGVRKEHTRLGAEKGGGLLPCSIGLFAARLAYGELDRLVGG